MWKSRAKRSALFASAARPARIKDFICFCLPKAPLSPGAPFAFDRPGHVGRTANSRRREQGRDNNHRVQLQFLAVLYYSELDYILYDAHNTLFVLSLAIVSYCTTIKMIHFYQQR